MEKSTSGTAWRTADATRLAISSVACRLVPSGARIPTSNSPWSSIGRKFLATTKNSGPLDRSTATAMPATMPRWLSAQCSQLTYCASIRWNTPLSRDAWARWPVPFTSRRTRSHRAPSIGVSVKLTSSATRMANAIVNPKLCRNRPAIPDMNPTGRKIATSDNVVAMTASPISLVASTAASKGGRPFSSMNR